MKINTFFIHETRSRNCDTGWVLCHISMVFISIPFKPQKVVSPSIHSNFQVSSPRGLPCGMTEVRPYLT